EREASGPGASGDYPLANRKQSTLAAPGRLGLRSGCERRFGSGRASATRDVRAVDRVKQVLKALSPRRGLRVRTKPRRRELGADQLAQPRTLGMRQRVPAQLVEYFVDALGGSGL